MKGDPTTGKFAATLKEVLEMMFLPDEIHENTHLKIEINGCGFTVEQGVNESKWNDDGSLESNTRITASQPVGIVHPNGFCEGPNGQTNETVCVWCGGTLF